MLVRIVISLVIQRINLAAMRLAPRVPQPPMRTQ